MSTCSYEQRLDSTGSNVLWLPLPFFIFYMPLYLLKTAQWDVTCCMSYVLCAVLNLLRLGSYSFALDYYLHVVLVIDLQPKRNLLLCI